MAKHKLTDAVALVGGMNFGGGNIDLNRFNSGSVSVNPASIAATTRLAHTATITGIGLILGDVIVLVPPAALNDDLLYVGCRVTGVDTVDIYIYNPTAGAIDDAALNWDFLHFGLDT